MRCGDHAAGAAFGDGERGVAQAEVVENDLLERIGRVAAGGVEPVFKRFFEAAGELVDALLGGGGIFLGAKQRELDVAGVGQDGGFNVGVGGVDGGQKLVGLGLGNHGGAQGALGDVSAGARSRAGGAGRRRRRAGGTRWAGRGPAG